MRLTENQLRVLISLAGGDKHGYAIIKDVASHNRQRVRLSAGTLYPILNRLMREGLIEETRERPVAALDDERRRYYRITSRGRRQLLQARRNMQEMLTLIFESGLSENSL